MSKKIKLKFKTIGADPEFLLKQNGNFIPSCLFFDGTKEFPEEVDVGFAILKDNLLVEGNIPPSDSKEGYIQNMERLKLYIKQQLPENVELISEDIAEFSEEDILSEDGQEFGCSSYIDIYREALLPSPRLIGNKRQVGAHIHIGYEVILNTTDETSDDIALVLAKALDYFIGIPSDQIHLCKERREGYGKLGSIRLTSYGLEYRSLGGFFAKSKYIAWQYEQVQKAIEFCSDIDNYEKLKIVNMADEKFYDFLEINLMDQVPELKLVEN
jgi:hypothetical protein